MSRAGRNRRLLGSWDLQTYPLKSCLGQALCVSITFMGPCAPVPVLK